MSPLSYFLSEIRKAARLPERPEPLFAESGALPSAYAVSDLAAASVGAAGEALADLIAARHGTPPEVAVDRRLASFWFKSSLRPDGWELPPVWDAVAGDYATGDGWIRLHTNAPHHRKAALSVLGVPNDETADRTKVAAAVREWDGTPLEDAIVSAGGCAGEMRSAADWATHPQGRAVAAEPLLHHEAFAGPDAATWEVVPARPLTGIKVLDLTRVLAGPTATRFLAGYGADVLRVDPPQELWDEALEEEMLLGKRSAVLDLRTENELERLKELIADADVMVHGYRSDALAAFGLDAPRRRALNPGLVDVSLCAYGWTGPWATRRGFDSIVQMSSGIAETGMRHYGKDKPTPLPVQALDYATGFIVAAAVLSGLAERVRSGAGATFRTSLARTANLLEGQFQADGTPEFAPETEADLAPQVENTHWGPARRLASPVELSTTPVFWSIPAGPVGTSEPVWRTA
ncbi:CoA transferase [Nisaea acidiphila]|uniref:CoA transferase n=1 Tax=Nisaea acidiphila TaxID=1862145 RepID=A0A9J7ANZ8_9PROT|nr:CoA transferase [Nisaea acidiphila]UUX49355.1 CoA transferase [Nisaea acidiphila]